MSLLVPLALLLLVAVALGLGLARANELFFVRFEGREVRLLRGRVPQRLLDDITDVIRAEPAGRGAVRVVVEDRMPRVRVEGGLSPAQAQRIRNAVGMWPLAKIRNAARRR